MAAFCVPVRAAFAIGAALLLCAWEEGAATPQAVVPPSPQRITGKVLSYDTAGRVLLLSAGRKDVEVNLQPDLRVVLNSKRTLNDIKPGDYVGATLLQSAAGKYRALEVHIFPDELRGTGEGLTPVGDAGSRRAMLNATVAGVASKAPNDGVLRLSYRAAAASQAGPCAAEKDAAPGSGCQGEAEVAVVPGVPIIGIAKGDESRLVPDARVSLSAFADADGRLHSSRLTVESPAPGPGR